MEEQDGDGQKEEIKLGKLQFSLDYDFQKGEVRHFHSVCIQIRRQKVCGSNPTATNFTPLSSHDLLFVGSDPESQNGCSTPFHSIIPVLKVTA